MATLLSRLRELFCGRHAEAELAEELETHRTMLEADAMRRGASPEDARRQAQIRLGGDTQIREAWRNERRFAFMDSVRQDFRYGVRSFAKNPVFTLVAILTLALGIGATGAVFSIVNAVLLKPLSYGHPERLVLVWQSWLNGAIRNPPPAVFLAWREHAQSFEQVSAVANRSMDLRGSPPARLRAAEATANFFNAVDVQPALGRAFTEEEARQGAHLAVLSHTTWKNHFASDPNILGKSIVLSGEPWTVIGVMPPTFSFMRAHDLWVPMDLRPGKSEGHTSLLVVGRLRNQTTTAQATAELSSLQAAQAAESSNGCPKCKAFVMPLRNFLLGDNARRMLSIWLGAVAIVLLVACTNVANLLLVRGANRRKEIAMRMALGAAHGRVVRQLIVETMVLAIGGACAGIGLAYLMIRYFAGLSMFQAPGAPPVALDWRVVAFICVVALVTAVLSGIAPAFKAARVSLVEIMKATSAAAVGQPHRERLRSALVVAEISISVVLLAGAGLLVRSFRNIVHVDPGFDPAGLLTMEVSRAGDPTPEQERNFYDAVLERVRALPGVKSGDVCTTLPIMGWNYGAAYRTESQPASAIQRQFANLQVISDGYFRTLGLKIARGRAFNESDSGTSTPTVIINEHLAARVFGGEDPIGKTMIIAFGAKDGTARQVVGIAADVKDEALNVPASDNVYLPFEQVPVPFEYLVVRATADTEALTSELRSAIASVDKDQPIEDIATMEARLNESLSSQRFAVELLGGFAVLALALCVIGIYGVAAYNSAQRTAEFGLRMALGAPRSSVLRLVVAGSVRAATIGCVIGLGVAIGVSRVMTSLLFGVSTRDPLTFAAAVLLILMTAVLAALLPAMRATRIEPMTALRYE